ncbi:MAG: hypothetical protein R6V04_13395 [bacterium]
MKKFILSILIIVCPLLLTAQQKDIDHKKIDLYVTKTMQEFDVPGVSIAIVKDGKVILTRGYGVREKGKEKKLMLRPCSP